jgi:hypothetical protein
VCEAELIYLKLGDDSERISECGVVYSAEHTKQTRNDSMAAFSAGAVYSSHLEHAESGATAGPFRSEFSQPKRAETVVIAH